MPRQRWSAAATAAHGTQETAGAAGQGHLLPRVDSRRQRHRSSRTRPASVELPKRPRRLPDHGQPARAVMCMCPNRPVRPTRPRGSRPARRPARRAPGHVRRLPGLVDTRRADHRRRAAIRPDRTRPYRAHRRIHPPRPSRTGPPPPPRTLTPRRVQTSQALWRPVAVMPARPTFCPLPRAERFTPAATRPRVGRRPQLLHCRSNRAGRRSPHPPPAPRSWDKRSRCMGTSGMAYGGPHRITCRVSVIAHMHAPVDTARSTDLTRLAGGRGDECRTADRPEHPRADL